MTRRWAEYIEQVLNVEDDREMVNDIVRSKVVWKC